MPAMNPAREQILRAAENKTGRRFGRRHLQQAVCIVRHNRLVSDIVLRRAGFRTEKRKG